MKIYLYNVCNNGDIFFNQPIIRNMCINNPNHNFSMFCKNNSYILSDIQQLTTYSTITDFATRVYDLFFFINDDILAINMWIGALAAHPHITETTLNKIECNLKEYVISFKKVLHYLEMNHNIIIQMDDYKNDLFSPIIPPVSISEFEEWYHKRHNNNKLVFYYNFYPKSNQTIPVIDHDSLLKEIVKEHSSIIFLLPTISNELEQYIEENGITNVLDCSKQFNCPENITSETLSKFEKIAEKCDYSIHFDIGGCLFYCNNQLHKANNKVFHFSITDFYYKRLIMNCPEIESKVTFIEAKNVRDVYLTLTYILSYN